MYQIGLSYRRFCIGHLSTILPRKYGDGVHTGFQTYLTVLDEAVYFFRWATVVAKSLQSLASARMGYAYDHVRSASYVNDTPTAGSE